MNNIFQPKNTLVTGGSGFIGSHFIRYFLEKYSECKIVNLDKLTYAGSEANLADVTVNKRYLFYKGDICDKALVKSILNSHKIDTIVHFAAESHVDRSITGPADFIQTNIVGTFTLLEAANTYWIQNGQKTTVNSCRFHHISTDEVYGTLSATAAPFTEATPYAPNSPYSASKASSDHLVRAYFSTFDLPVTISNCSNNYGAYQHQEKFIPTIINACLNKQIIPVYGDGSNIRDWLYVIDHCAAIDAIIHKGIIGETYNVGGTNEISNVDLVKSVCEIMDELKPHANKYINLIEFVSDRPGHDWRYAIDSSKITQQLQWKPQKLFKDNLLQTIKWYLSQQKN